MDEHPPSSSSLRAPLLDPELVENSNYVVNCNPPSVGSAGSLRLEEIMRSWFDQHDNATTDDAAGQLPNDNDDDEDLAQGPEELHRSERACRLPWYKNPLQIMAMISNFSTSFNVVNLPSCIYGAVTAIFLNVGVLNRPLSSSKLVKRILPLSPTKYSIPLFLNP